MCPSEMQRRRVLQALLGLLCLPAGAAVAAPEKITFDQKHAFDDVAIDSPAYSVVRFLSSELALSPSLDVRPSPAGGP